MKKKHNYVCINCPLSCALELTEEDGEVLEVTGSECKVGAKYAEQEFLDARRVVTTTVAVEHGVLPLLPVRTSGAIPKPMVREAVKAVEEILVEAPVSAGQVIMTNILDTGVDVVATRNLDSAT